MQKFILGTFLLLSLAVINAVAVDQSWKYRLLEQQVKGLEQQQIAIYEENKRLLGAIAELESPERLISLIESNEQWNLKKLDANDLILIKMEGK